MRIDCKRLVLAVSAVSTMALALLSLWLPDGIAPGRSPGPPAGGTTWTTAAPAALSRLAPYRLPLAQAATDLTAAEIAFYSRRAHQHPGDGYDRAFLARAYLRQARLCGDTRMYLLAEQAARLSLERLPFFNDSSHLVLARVAEARHDFEDAIRIAGEVLARQPGNDEALSIQASAMLAAGRLTDARRVADKLFATSPSLTTATVEAQVLAAQGDDPQAIALLRRAIGREQSAERSASAWARATLGKILERRGDRALAGELYQEAVRIAPSHAQAVVALASWCVAAGDGAQARRLIEARPTWADDALSLSMLARCRLVAGDLAGATALDLQAETVLRRELSIGSFGHRRDLARLLLARGDSRGREEALKLAQDELARRRDALTLDTLAWAQHASGLFAKARATIEEALATGLKDPAMMSRAARIAAAQGDAIGAAAWARRARSIDPAIAAAMPAPTGGAAGPSAALGSPDDATVRPTGDLPARM